MPTVLIVDDSKSLRHIIKKSLKNAGFKNLLEAGSPRVIIADGRVDNPVKDALAGKGTVIE